MKILRIVSLALLLAAGAFATPSHAAVSRNLTYGESLIWRCAVRLIRVDLGYQLIERDMESGYLLFEYKESDRLMTGAIEVLSVETEGRRYVRVQVKLNHQPSYVESVLINKLEKKLKNDFGPPPEAERIAPTTAKGSEARPSQSTRPRQSEENIDADDLDDIDGEGEGRASRRGRDAKADRNRNNRRNNAPTDPDIEFDGAY
ncbi:MAG: hypothetical protein M0R76_13095 [Proteobacteria bacterium]|nr:hypothetical protein [Pseudomonadota bacterium]